MQDEIEIKTISVDEAKQRLDQQSAVFLDVRDPGSYQTAHIPGAILVNDDNLNEIIGTADKSQTHILYCYHGVSSQGGAAYFQEMGFKDVYSMDRGFSGWHHQFDSVLEQKNSI
ncbi:MAG: thiosulfate sulfurtransferase GlpE [SAR324 cluster bacterium]|nr:thiosulfate sulfurtransferase GlpE [SAR324 cluster bacterium]